MSGKREHSEYLFVRQKEGLFFHLIPVASLEIEPSIGRILSGKVLFVGVSEKHVGGERLIVQCRDGPPPLLNHW